MAASDPSPPPEGASSHLPNGALSRTRRESTEQGAAGAWQRRRGRGGGASLPAEGLETYPPEGSQSGAKGCSPTAPPRVSPAAHWPHTSEPRPLATPPRGSPSCLGTPRPGRQGYCISWVLPKEGSEARGPRVTARRLAASYGGPPAPVLRFPRPVLRVDCTSATTTQGWARGQRCPRTQALAKETLFCAKVTLLFLIMKIAGN